MLQLHFVLCALFCVWYCSKTTDERFYTFTARRQCYFCTLHVVSVIRVRAFVSITAPCWSEELYFITHSCCSINILSAYGWEDAGSCDCHGNVDVDIDY